MPKPISVGCKPGNVVGFVTSAWRGEAKGVGNIVIGASNIGGEAIGNPQTASYEPKNSGEAYGMRVVEVMSVFGGLLGGRRPAGVFVAESKTTSAVAAEVGNASRAKTTAQIIWQGVMLERILKAIPMVSENQPTAELG